MRALLITCSVTHPKLPSRLFDRPIVAGPGWPDAQTLAGSWRSLRTAHGDYEIADILGKIPSDQQPDLIVCFGDSGATSRPRNLQQFSGRKIMALARDLAGELSQPDFFRYLSVESFDHVVAAETSAALEQLLDAERRRLLELAPGASPIETLAEPAAAVAC